MKDNFSVNSNLYSQYRPGYPDDFFEYLQVIQPTSENAWDCGTGSGQVAQKLAGLYKKVFATDISQAQIDNAVKLDNIHYSVQPAEKTDFPDHFFDLVIVAQAVHWFDFDMFYLEVNRTSKSNALLVIIGYGRLKVSSEIDFVIDHFYKKIIGSYWDKERKYIDENYQTIPFPFEELPTPQFQNVYQWSLENLIGYLGTWSAVNHFKKEKGFDPIDLIKKDLKQAWGQEDKRTTNFPLLLRIGKIRSVR